jgi:hypothetical protein
MISWIIGFSKIDGRSQESGVRSQNLLSRVETTAFGRGIREGLAAPAYRYSNLKPGPLAMQPLKDLPFRRTVFGFGRHEPEQNILGVGVGIGVAIAIGIGT